MIFSSNNQPYEGPINNNTKPYLPGDRISTIQAAQELGVSESSLRRLVIENDFAHVIIGGVCYISSNSLSPLLTTVERAQATSRARRLAQGKKRRQNERELLGVARLVQEQHPHLFENLLEEFRGGGGTDDD